MSLLSKLDHVRIIIDGNDSKLRDQIYERARARNTPTSPARAVRFRISNLVRLEVSDYVQIAFWEHKL